MSCTAVGRNPSPRIGRNPSARPPTEAAPLAPIGAATVLDANGWLVSLIEDDTGITITVDWDLGTVPASPVPSDGLLLVWPALGTGARPVVQPAGGGELVMDIITHPAGLAPVAAGMFLDGGATGALDGFYTGGGIEWWGSGTPGGGTTKVWNTGDLSSGSGAVTGVEQTLANVSMTTPLTAPINTVSTRSRTRVSLLDGSNELLARGERAASVNWTSTVFWFVLAVYPQTGATGQHTIKVKPYSGWIPSRTSRGVR